MDCYDEVIRKGTLYEDPDFKPTQKSLFKSPVTGLDKETAKMWKKKFEWKKASEIYPDGYQVFDGKPIGYGDVKQGLLGTCYFISAIVSAISHLERVTDLFLTKEVNGSGIYAVRFIINGEYKIITVDDYFVVNTDTGLPAFSMSTKTLIWPLILEKAWAKLNGNFENIITGYPHDVLSFLIPGPSLYIDLKRGEYTDEQLWKMVTRGFYSNHIMGGITHTVKTGPHLKKFGLVPNHSYSIIQCVSFSTKTDGEVKLLRLQNPWGSLEWKGGWGNNDSKWTKSILSKTGCDVSTPGLFYIPFKEYIKHFKVTTITENEPGYKLKSLQLKKHEKYAVVELELTEAGQLYFSVNQVNPRLLKEHSKSIASSPGNIMIARCKPIPKKIDELQYIDGKFSHERELVWNSLKSMQKGKYLIFIEIEWLKEVSFTEYYVSVYSESTAKLRDVTKAHQKEDLLQRMLVSGAEKRTKPYSYEDHQDQQGEQVGKIDLKRAMSVEDTGGDYGYIYYTNNSPAVVLNEELNFSSLEGYRVEGSDSPNKVKVNVSPNSNKLILIKRNSNQSKFSVGFRSKITYDTSELMKDIAKKGQKNQVKADGKEYQIYFYILDHPDGYIFEYQNLEKDAEFEATFNFKLENLRIVDDEKVSQVGGRKMWSKAKLAEPTLWTVKLKPGEKTIKKLEIINDYDRMGFKFDYKFKVLDTAPKELSEASLKTLIKSKGTRYELIEGDNKKIYYYVYTEIKGAYYFMFQNLEPKTLEGVATFELENMKLDQNDGGKNTWKIALKPNQIITRKIAKIKPGEAGSCCPSFSYVLK